MLNETKEKIVAYVSPRSLGGQSLLSTSAKLTSEHIRSYFSEKAVYGQARSKLESMGFKVEKVSELCVRISASAATFNKKMGVKFQKDTSKMYLPTLDTAPNALDLNTDLLEGVVFPQPTRLHGKKLPAKKGRVQTMSGVSSSPLPGSPSYFRLDVSTDVARIMRADKVHQKGILGKGVKAAMIDSGFDWSHPYFQGKGFKLTATPPNDIDLNGHGTGESANLLAIAPEVDLVGIKMDDPVSAFQQARDQYKVNLISNSWGTQQDTDGAFSSWDPYWSLVLAEISLCVNTGIVVLFSAGNGQQSVTASSPDVISVGGAYCDQSGNLFATEYASSFKSFRFQGRLVPDVCGLCGNPPRAIYISLPVPPGCEIDKEFAGGAWPNGDETGPRDGWAAFSGTSAACPMVAGVVALMLSQTPSLTPKQIRKRLYDSCQDVTQGKTFQGDRAVPGPDLATGAGLVDASKACL
jgi:subtilisin family serine protease